MSEETAKAPAANDNAAEIASLKAALAEAIAAKDKALSDMKYALADAANTKRMAAEDAANAKKFGAMAMVKDLVGVMDNFGRALDTLPEKVKNDPEAKSVIEGVIMIKTSFEQAFARHGVIEIEAQGQKFDPNIHQAVMQVPATTEVPAGHVATVAAKGYTLNGRVVRPSVVLVAK